MKTLYLKQSSALILSRKLEEDVNILMSPDTHSFLVKVTLRSFIVRVTSALCLSFPSKCVKIIYPTSLTINLSFEKTYIYTNYYLCHINITIQVYPIIKKIYTLRCYRTSFLCNSCDMKKSISLLMVC